jgi:23S rRNA (uracil1939-C5)-methyltransferase
VDRIAAGGNGVGREESGRVVFVPRTVPGDVADVAIAEERSRWARGWAVRFLERGSGWRSAPCPLYDRCGGCQVQHLDPREQRRAKRGLVEDALRRIGGMDLRVPELVAVGSEFLYRNRVTFSVRSGGRSPVVGYLRLDEPDAVVEVSTCLLAEPAISTAWEGICEAWDADAILPQGEDIRITLRGSADGEVDLLIRGGAAVAPAAYERLLSQVPGLIGCHHLRADGSLAHLAGAKTLEDRWQGIEFDLPADVFLQVNRTVSAAMDGWLDERAGDVDGISILDLYAGVGARAIRWAGQGARVTACEVSGAAVDAGTAAASSVGAEVAFVADRVEQRVASLWPADLVVVNPPRAGLSRRVSRALVAGEARSLAYVSCDPATLARDLVRLESGWQVREVQPFDAFPQTAHVETIAWLDRR